MKRLLTLSLMAAFVFGLALSHPALAKNDKDKKEKKEKSNSRVERVLVCQATKAEPGAIPSTEYRTGKIIAVAPSAVEAHIRHGDELVFDEEGMLLIELLEEGAEPVRGAACGFLFEPAGDE